VVVAEYVSTSLSKLYWRATVVHNGVLVIKEQFKRTVKLAIHVSLFTLIMVARLCVPLGPNFGSTYVLLPSNFYL
jgi:hypothetical protein